MTDSSVRGNKTVPHPVTEPAASWVRGGGTLACGPAPPYRMYPPDA